MSNKHKALAGLERISKEFPNIWDHVNRLRERPPERLSGWSDHCYIPPNLAWMAIAACKGVTTEEEFNQLPSNIDLNLGGGVGLSVLASWRMTKGIYRIDPLLYNSLMNTSLGGKLPSKVFEQLPQWCVYIETPNLSMPSINIHGVWCARLEDTEVDGSISDTLVLLLNTDTLLIPLVLDLTKETLAEAVSAPLVKSEEQTAELGFSYDVEGVRSLSEQFAEPILNLLIYICTQSDISSKGRFDVQPSNPKPKKTRKKGIRLFASSGLTKWDVGIRMGANLRSALDGIPSEGGGGVGGKKRPHVRNAHWHLYYKGKRKDEQGNPIPKSKRAFDIKWLSPAMINAESGENLPAVIRRVKE